MWFRILYILFLALCVLSANGQSQRRMSPEEYISLYKELAVVNMKEKKVPASITLAQAMFESDFGNSPLALNANNHFGIKCHNTWDGATFHQDDDAKDECFRKYDNPLLSFEDHSDFLRSRDRYSSLFQLDIDDYKGWAHGLKEAGYATNPNYASKLIDLIERYNLYLLDTGKDLPTCREDLTAHRDEKMEKAEKRRFEASAAGEPSLFYKAPDLSPNGYINDIPYVIAGKNDTWFSIAQEKDMMLWQVLKYNDADKNDALREGSIVFLKPKKNAAAQDFHIANQGDSPWGISQKYGIRLNRLYRFNHMMPGATLQPGQKVALR